LLVFSACYCFSSRHRNGAARTQSTHVPESDISTCDNCIHVVKAIGADGPPNIEDAHFQSPA